MTGTASILANIADSLARGPYKEVHRDVELPDHKTADITASRTYVSWKGLVILSQHILVRHTDDATEADVNALFEAGFKYGKKVNRVPLFRGLQFGFMVVPVIVGTNPDQKLIEAVKKPPQKRWALFEYPIVVDSSSSQSHYFTGSAIWGKFFFSDLRKVADQHFSEQVVFAAGNSQLR